MTTTFIPSDQENPNPEELLEPIFPRLKNGIFISTSTVKEEGSITIATSFHGIEIIHSKARSIIEHFTGALSTVEIASQLDLPLSIIDSIIKELLNVNFLDTQRNTIKLINLWLTTYTFSENFASRPVSRVLYGVDLAAHA